MALRSFDPQNRLHVAEMFLWPKSVYPASMSTFGVPVQQTCPPLPTHHLLSHPPPSSDVITWTYCCPSLIPLLQLTTAHPFRSHCFPPVRSTTPPPIFANAPLPAHTPLPSPLLSRSSWRLRASKCDERTHEVVFLIVVGIFSITTTSST